MTDENEAPAWAADAEADQVEELRRELGSTRHRLTQVQEDYDQAKIVIEQGTNFRAEQAVRLMELEGEARAAETARERLVDDIRTICDSLLDEAERREWCTEYEAFCDTVNNRLSQKWLKSPEREHSYRYVVSITLDHRVRDEPQIREDIQGALEGVGEHISAAYNNIVIDVDRQR